MSWLLGSSVGSKDNFKKFRDHKEILKKNPKDREMDVINKQERKTDEKGSFGNRIINIKFFKDQTIKTKKPWCHLSGNFYIIIPHFLPPITRYLNTSSESQNHLPTGLTTWSGHEKSWGVGNPPCLSEVPRLQPIKGRASIESETILYQTGFQCETILLVLQDRIKSYYGKKKGTVFTF